MNSGYYTPEALEARAIDKKLAAKAKKLQDLRERRDKKINEANNDFVIYEAIINFDLPTHNVIYYNHSNELVFNWKNDSYSSKVTNEQFSAFVEYLYNSNVIANLPKDINFKIKQFS